MIGPQDVARVTQLIGCAEENSFVKRRRQRNLGQPRPDITRSTAWMAVIGCLLTTQQKSGPGKPVSRFLGGSPFPLSYRRCQAQRHLEPFARDILSGFGGIRRSPTIANQIVRALCQLEDGEWDILLAHAARVDAANDYRVERVAARYVAKTFDGFGPKQARNFFQWLGVAKYEIPIDSRVTKWLNREILSFELNANLLSDATYYEMVSDGVIDLCRRAGIPPCVFDAAVFASFDRDERSDADVAAETLRSA